MKYKTFDSVLKVLFLYLIICAFTEATSYLLAINKTHNYFVRHTFTFLEFTFITIIYYIHFTEKKIRNFIGISYFIFLILCLVILGLKRGYNQPDNLLSSYEAAIFIYLSLYFLYKEINEQVVPRLNEYYFFWLNSAILVYFGISLFLFLFGVLIEKSDLVVYNFFKAFSLMINITYNILLAISLWKIKKN